MKLRVAFFFILLEIAVYGQDSSFVKVYYGGSSFKVTEGKQWTIEKAYISSGDGYNILISDSNFKSLYKGGETLNIPYYIAEMELLSDRTNVSYILTIAEHSAPK